MLIDTLVIFDHAKHQLIVLANAHNQGDVDAAYDNAIRRIDEIVAALRQPLIIPQENTTPVDDELHSTMTREQYEEGVLKAKEYIAAGDAFQIVLSQRLSRKTNASPLSIYRALRATQPTVYVPAALQRGFHAGGRVDGDDGAPRRRDRHNPPDCRIASTRQR